MGMAKHAINPMGFGRGRQGTLAQGRVDLYPHDDRNWPPGLCRYMGYIGVKPPTHGPAQYYARKLRGVNMSKNLL